MFSYAQSIITLHSKCCCVNIFKFPTVLTAHLLYIIYSMLAAIEYKITLHLSSVGINFKEINLKIHSMVDLLA